MSIVFINEYDYPPVFYASHHDYYTPQGDELYEVGPFEPGGKPTFVRIRLVTEQDRKSYVLISTMKTGLTGEHSLMRDPKVRDVVMLLTLLNARRTQ